MFELYEKKETKSNASNGNLHKAKQAKNDEFYTQLSDIEKELMHYKPHFKDKIVYCNCDDPEWSNFWKYFHLNFAHLGLKKLIATFYHIGTSVYKMEYTGGDDNNISAGVKTPLIGNGDFRSEECEDILRGSDIVVTNPPFSLFREYVAVLMEHEKKFLIIGNGNAVTYKEIFPLIKDNLMWLGVTRQMTGSMWFRIPDDMPDKKGQKIENGIRYQTIGNSCWFTNLDVQYRHEKIILWKSYNATDFPQYDNFDAVEVSKVSDIPVDYDNVMGVPITFLGKYNPDQFEIIWLDGTDTSQWYGSGPAINGKKKYRRLFIRKKVGA